jgi:hypothetical protein
MHPKRILFICGSMNQTTQMHKIARELVECECVFSTFYGDRGLGIAKRLYLTEASVLGYRLSARTLAYLERHGLAIDQGGVNGPYDLVVTCSDQVIPRNIRQSPILLVQEGMTDPEGVFYRLWRAFPIVPRWLAGTSTNGLSGRYTLFCVASEGYRSHFIRKGADPGRIVVTGIPNFDNCRQYLINGFPHRHFVLVCTSDCRETFLYENRKAFILNAVRIANGRRLIFRLHPNERARRATREIEQYAPAALVYAEGHTEEMIANCDVLITRFSSTAYVGLALGKEVHSDFDVENLRRMTPIQTGGAAREIATRCRQLLEAPRAVPATIPRPSSGTFGWARRRHDATGTGPKEFAR